MNMTPTASSLSIDQARKVLWLRTYPRPMGELFDEGYLNRDRLQWAAEKAYDPRLKEAARILLNPNKSTQSAVKPVQATTLELPKEALSIGITLEKARSTAWPLHPYKGQPMGTLVETRQLSLKDLGYAVENAWDERVRRAASALLLVRMNQKVKEPAPSAGVIKVIFGGRSFAERRQLQYTLLEGCILGFLIGIGVAISIWAFISAAVKRADLVSQGSSHSPLSFLTVLILIILFGISFLGINLFNKIILGNMDKKIEAYRKGQEGEDKVVETILHSLDGNWSLFRNIQLPGRSKADLDAVLVGPPGVWVLEIKNYKGCYRNIGEAWQVQTRKGWRLLPKSPSRQAKNNASHLGEFLKADGINHWVNGTVVWANPESQLSVENPPVAVWPLDRLPDELGNIWQGDKLTSAMKEQIVKKLSKLNKAQ
jgi:hypothetical protein